MRFSSFEFRRQLGLFFLLIVAMVMLVPGQSQTTGLVGRWKLDEVSGDTAFDASGRNNHGTLTNAPTRVTPGARGGSGLSFDGINDYVELGNPPDLQITGALTVSAWFNTTAPLGNYKTLVSKWWSGGEDAAYSLAFNTTGLYFAIQNSAKQGASAQSSVALNDGNWHHAVGTWDGSTIRLYIDGAERASNSTAGFGSLQNTSRPVRIGTDARYTTDGNDRLFNGKVDDVRIYNRGLSLDEVQELYTLINHWPADGNANDSAGSNDGTINGATFGAGQTGSAFYFDGVNDYIDMGDIDAMDGQSKLTIALWANFTSLNEFAGLVSKRVDDTNRIGISLDFSGRNGIDEAGLLLANAQGNTFAYTNANVAAVGQWHHWAMVFDGTRTAMADRLKFFYDGVQLPLQFFGDIPATTPSNAAHFLIGSEGLMPGRYSNVAIDDIRLYNTTLSAAQLAGLAGTTGLIATSTSVGASASPSISGQAVTFTATVTKTGPGIGTPGGAITFKNGAATIGSGQLDATGRATFQTASLGVGQHSIVAVYGGDTRFVGSTSPALAHSVITVPGAPTNLLAEDAHGGTVQISFTPPGNNGGSPITLYTATSNPGSITATSQASPIRMPGLTYGTSYTFTVTASNAAGTGPASAPSNAVTPEAPRAVLQVTKTADTYDRVCNSDCSIRDALWVANHIHDREVVIRLIAGTYSLFSRNGPELGLYDEGEDFGLQGIAARGNLEIRPRKNGRYCACLNRVTIEGDSRATTIIDGARSTDSFIVISINATVTISSVTLRNSYSDGRIIYTEGKLTLTDVTVRDGKAGGVYARNDLHVLRSSFINNTWSGGGAIGTAITAEDRTTIEDSIFKDNFVTGSYSYGTALTTLRALVDITRSSFVNNTGGAIGIGRGWMTINNSTISGNSSYNPSSAGVFYGGGEIAILNSTISRNTAARGGALSTDGGSSGILKFSIQNTIIAGNTATAPNGETSCYILSGTEHTWKDLGGNITDDRNCRFSNVVPDVKLGDLVDPTNSDTLGILPMHYHPLLPGSPALDIVQANCPASDIRGNRRPEGTACDSGSFELPPWPRPGDFDMNPPAIAVASGPFTLVLTDRSPIFQIAGFATGFAPTSVVKWNGMPLQTSFVRGSCLGCPNQLHARVQAADVALPALVDITVFTPAPGGGTSPAKTFKISNPVPLLATNGIAPQKVVAGASGLLLSVFGSGFTSTSVVRLDAVDRPTAFKGPGQLVATLSAADLATARTWRVSVFNRAPDGGVTTEQTLTVENPQHTVSSLSPSEVTAGSDNISLTVNGSRFVQGAVVHWKGIPLSTTFNSPERLTATVPRFHLLTAGVAMVTVALPDIGVGNSSPQAFNIRASTAQYSAASVVSPWYNNVFVAAAEASMTLQMVCEGFTCRFGWVYVNKYNPIGVTVSGMGPNSSMAAEFNYALTTPEQNLALQYLDGTMWKPVRGSGNTPPQKITQDTAEWGGKFIVTFDNTSTPRLMDMNDHEIRFEARPDTTPPVITANVTGPAGLNGWYKGDVTVSWTATDPDSPVTLNACEDKTVTEDTSGITLTCTASSAGGTTVESKTIKRDARLPDALITTNQTEPGQWTNQTVTVNFACSDSGSGLAGSCPAPQTFASSGTFAAGGNVCDLAGNCTTISTLVLIDKTAPVLTVPTAINATTNAVGAIVNFTVTATDDLSGVKATPVCSAASGSFFMVGQTTVNCTAADHAGNTATASFQVNLAYSNGPALRSVPADMTTEAVDATGATVTYTMPTADGNEPVTCLPGSGTRFPVGQTTVTCEAQNSNGISRASFTVIVNDTTPPVLSGVPMNTTLEAASRAGTVFVYGLPGAVDAVSGNRPVMCSPASGSTFAFTTTLVSCSARDAAGNIAVAAFAVSVVDTTPPIFEAMPNISANATDNTGAIVNYTAAKATDSIGPVGPVSCTPESGSRFAIGTTAVTCSAIDGAGNTGSAGFNITVRDNPPVIGGMPGDITAEATSPAGAVVAYSQPTAADVEDGPLNVDCSLASGATFPLGTTTVSCSATDSRGNRAQAAFTVNVRDTVAPALSCAASDGLWHTDNVSLSCTATDSGSGLLQSADASFSLTTSVAVAAEVSNAATNSRTVCDKSNNCAAAGPIGGNKIDRRIPAISIAAPSNSAGYVLGAALTASYSCSDGGSGVQTCAGPVANGTALPLDTVGARTFTVNAADAAGNTASQSVGYNVTYRIIELYDASKAKQSGATIPIKIQLADAVGSNRSSAALTVHAVGVQRTSDQAPGELEDAGNANPDDNFRFTDGSYVFNLKTTGYATGTYALTFTVTADPVQHVVYFQIR